VVDMESLALHELGHLLGLGHIPAAVDPYSIMNPSLLIGEGLANRRVSRGDIERIQKIYGCVGKACNIDELFMSMEVPTYGSKDDQGDSNSEATHRASTPPKESSNRDPNPPKKRNRHNNSKQQRTYQR